MRLRDRKAGSRIYIYTYLLTYLYMCRFVYVDLCAIASFFFLSCLCVCAGDPVRLSINEGGEEKIRS